MDERLKRILVKDNPSDEELQLCLFAMNQQFCGIQGVLVWLCHEIKQQQLSLDKWIIPRLKSERPISDGLRNELRIAMDTMRGTVMSLDVAIEYLNFFQDERNRHYMEADVIGHFDWQKK